MCETFDIGITCSLNVLRSSYVEPLSLFYLCHVSESSWGGGGGGGADRYWSWTSIEYYYFLLDLYLS